MIKASKNANLLMDSVQRSAPTTAMAIAEHSTGGRFLKSQSEFSTKNILTAARVEVQTGYHSSLPPKTLPGPSVRKSLGKIEIKRAYAIGEETSHISKSGRTTGYGLNKIPLRSDSPLLSPKKSHKELLLKKPLGGVILNKQSYNFSKKYMTQEAQ